MRTTIFPALLVLASFFLFSCDKDDSDGSGGGGNPSDTPQPEDQMLSCTLNGESFSAAYPFVAGTYGGSTGSIARAASGTVIRNNGDTVSVVIVITSFNTADFQAGSEFNADNTALGKYCFGAVNVHNHPTEIQALSTEYDVQVAGMTITAYDTINEVFSGTFYFNAQDDEGNSFIVTDGEFHDVEYD